MSIAQKVQDALAKGEVPLEFLEENRLLPETHPAAKTFATDMQRVYDRLLKGTLGEGYSKADSAVRFMLSVDKEPNAFIVTSAKPPVITMSTGLVELCQNESELAAVLGHELGHDYFAKMVGAAREVGKLEELGADLRVPYMLRKADYPQDAMRKVMQKFPDEDAFQRVFKAWNDEHPTRATRVSALEAVERGLVRASGMGMGEQKNIVDAPVSGTVKSAGRSASFTSYMEKTLAEKGYAAAPVERKIEILDDIIRSELPKTDPYFKSRIEDVARHLEELPLSKTNPKHRAGVRKLVDSMMHHGTPSGARDLNAGGEVAEHLYPALQKAYLGEEATKGMFGARLKPIGVLEDLDLAIFRFKQATTLEEAKSAAGDLNRLAKEIPFTADRGNSGGISGMFTRRVQDKVRFEGFEIPEYEKLAKATSPIKPSWDKLAELAAQSKDPEIVTALARLGVNKDPRIAAMVKELPPVHHLARPQTGYNVISFGGTGGGEHELRFNEHGQITGLEKVSADSKLVNSLLAEEAVIAERVASERALLAKTNWSELERDFGGFVEKHKKQLTPHLGQVSGESPFAEEFVKQCDALVRKNPEKFKPEVTRFFAATDSSFGGYRNSSRLAQFAKAESEAMRGQGNGGYFTGKWGVAPDHPFAKFVMEDQHGLFNPAQKLEFLGNTRLFEVDPRKAATPEAKWLIKNEHIFDGLPKKNLAELEAWLHDVQKTLPPKLEGEFRGFRPMADLVHYEVYRTIAQTTEPLDINAVHRIRDLASFHSGADSVVNSALRSRVNQLTAQTLKRFTPAQDAGKLIEEFRMLAAERTGATYLPSIFSEHPELRTKYQQAIEQAVGKVTDHKAKADLLESMLFETKYQTPHSPLLERVAPHMPHPKDWEKSLTIKPITYEGSIVDPAFKEWTAREYAAAVANTLGKDDGTPQYAERFKATVNRIIEGAPPSNSRDILERMGKKKLGNVLQLQDELAGFIGKEIERTKPRQAVQYNFHASVGETALEMLGENYSTREATIDFLTEPFSKDRATKLIEKIGDRAKRESEKGAKFLAEGMSHEAKVEQMQLLHKNFWNLPFEARTLAAEQILFRDVERGASEAGEIDRSVRYVLDKVMPVAEGQAKAEMVAGRNVIESYLEATKNFKDKRLITSAMLVANEPNGAFAGKLSMGKGLGLVLDALGPAGKKLKQAIESHPDTPADIKLQFKDSKTMAVDPQRHDILKWVEDSNKELAAEQRIVKTGKVLGAGSYGITVEGFRADGKKIARTILYPNVRESAEHEFTILKDASEVLTKKDPRFNPVIDMVRQADAMSAIETDMDIAAKQAQVAKKLYSGVEVTVEGKKYTFGTADYLGHGVNHKDFEVVEGVHFNDLAHAAQTVEEKAHVRGLAKAQITAELHNLLAGRPFDHDVHGGQQKIIGNHIVRFDHGAQSVCAASAREKQMIGHVLGGTIKQHYVKGVPIQEALAKEIERVAQSPAEKDFLRSVQRGILALGNFQSHMGGEADELGKVIGSVFASGKVDAGIKSAMEERLGMLSGKAFKELEKAGKASGISISAVEHTFEASPDKSPLRAAPKDSLMDSIPMKQEHIQAGIGAAAGFAGFAMLLHANHRINKKKEKGEEITGWDRAEQIGGGVLGVGGSAATVDGLAFKGNGLKTLGGFNEKTAANGIEQAETFFRNAEGKLKFGKVSGIIVGAVVVGGTLLHLLSKKKQNDMPGGEKLWTDRIRSNSGDSQQLSAGM